MNKELLDFLKSQRLITIASGEDDSIWVNNAYYSITDDFEFFFISPKNTKHSKLIDDNAKVAFNVAWYNPNDLGDRKAIQGFGECMELTDAKEITRLLKNHHKFYPIWKNKLTLVNMRKKIVKSKPYIIKPTYIKYWDDKLYGAEGTKEFNF